MFTLQALPGHLTRKVVLRASQWTKIDMLDSLPSTGNPMWKILKYVQLCQSWRFYCQPLVCQEVSISMNKALDALNTSHYWLPTVSDIVERNGLSHTKYAHIQIAYSALLSGKLASLLSQAPYCHGVFPQVSSVQLSFTKGGALYGFEDSKCIDSVDRFVKQTRAMFPNATLYSISNTAHCLPEEVNITKHYNMLVSKLTKDISQIKYYTASDLFNVSAALSASALTHLVYSECSGVNYFIQLIKCNANTLQSLCLDLEHPDKLACILQSNDGMQVTYPCLSALKTVCAGDAVATRRATLMHAPVPNLVNLTMTHSYPFTNDALFRGNYSRLRQLSLQLDIIDLLILEKSGVMERQRFPNLAELEVDLNLVDQPFNACFGQKVCQILLELAPNIESLKLHVQGFPYKSFLLSSFASLPMLKNLRFLTISGFPLSLRETVGLLRRLPNLSQLILDPYTEEVDDEDEEAELIHRAAEVQYMQELLSGKELLAVALKQVVFLSSLHSDFNGTSHFACQLAILCSGISCVRWSYHSSAFDTCCKTNTADELYEKHKSRLEEVDWQRVK